MAATAAKLGKAPLHLDWTQLIQTPPKTPDGRKAYGPDNSEIIAAWDKLSSQFAKDEVGFYRTSDDEKLSQAQASRELAQKILTSGQFTDVLFIGIGGSALGPISLLDALSEKRQSSLQFHFQENPDPIFWKSTIEKLSPERTLVCSVTKSGGTFETLALTQLALAWLGKDRWMSHVVAITDPQKGDLRKFAEANQIPTLAIAPSIGGRFSIFSPVGLFPAALAGLSIDAFLEGARQVQEYCEKTPIEKNPLSFLASDLIARYRTHPIHVCLPYSTRLRRLGEWWVQLWGESLGKDGKGFTPLSGVGAIDQHSLLQLLRDGANDKVTCFITLSEVDDPVKIPAIPLGTSEHLESFTRLQGHSLQKLLKTEYQATALVLSRNQRPHFTLQLDRLDEKSLGALYFSFSILTALTGTLWEINPFDQPGVEEGKIYTKNALQEEGFSMGSPEGEEIDVLRRIRRNETKHEDRT
jgi:glucose-6-phosphate isomerase